MEPKERRAMLSFVHMHKTLLIATAAERRLRSKISFCVLYSALVIDAGARASRTSQKIEKAA